MNNFKYGLSSTNKLQTVAQPLRRIAYTVLRRSPVDIVIVSGYRNEREQSAAFASGNSTVKYPNSKHNATLADGTPMSQALDFAPIVRGAIPWKDTHLFAFLYGLFYQAAKEENVKLRWGGDWDMDGETTDQTFMDWGHVELYYD